MENFSRAFLVKLDKGGLNVVLIAVLLTLHSAIYWHFIPSLLPSQDDWNFLPFRDQPFRFDMTSVYGRFVSAWLIWSLVNVATTNFILYQLISLIIQLSTILVLYFTIYKVTNSKYYAFICIFIYIIYPLRIIGIYPFSSVLHFYTVTLFTSLAYLVFLLWLDRAKGLTLFLSSYVLMTLATFTYDQAALFTVMFPITYVVKHSIHSASTCGLFKEYKFYFSLSFILIFILFYFVISARVGDHIPHLDPARIYSMIGVVWSEFLIPWGSEHLGARLQRASELLPLSGAERLAWQALLAALLAGILYVTVRVNEREFEALGWRQTMILLLAGLVMTFFGFIPHYVTGVAGYHLIFLAIFVSVSWAALLFSVVKLTFAVASKAEMMRLHWREFGTAIALPFVFLASGPLLAVIHANLSSVQDWRDVNEIREKWINEVVANYKNLTANQLDKIYVTASNVPTSFHSATPLKLVDVWGLNNADIVESFPAIHPKRLRVRGSINLLPYENGAFVGNDLLLRGGNYRTTRYIAFDSTSHHHYNWNAESRTFERVAAYNLSFDGQPYRTVPVPDHSDLLRGRPTVALDLRQEVIPLGHQPLANHPSSKLSEVIRFEDGSRITAITLEVVKDNSGRQRYLNLALNWELEKKRKTPMLLVVKLVHSRLAEVFSTRFRTQYVRAADEAREARRYFMPLMATAGPHLRYREQFRISLRNNVNKLQAVGDEPVDVLIEAFTMVMGQTTSSVGGPIGVKIERQEVE